MKTCYIRKKHCLLAAAALPIIILVSLLLSMFAFGESLNGKVIIVDAGHGGIDSGANRPGAVEKDINLAVTLQVKSCLNDRGAKVVLTRESDVDLSELCDDENVRGRYRRDLNARLEMVDESDADIFVSLHANASKNPSRRGSQCYYAVKSELGKRLAASIEEELRTVVAVNQPYTSADFFVLRRNRVPAVLIEMGFITNPDELALLNSPEYQRKLGEAIAKGIENYYRLQTY